MIAGMSSRLLVLAIAPLFAAATAHAQAPGEMPPSAPPTAAPGAPGGIAVMENRWAVGLAFGGMGLAPEDAPDAKTNFGIGQLSLRFRATYHLELELAMAGGRQQLDNGQDGDLAVGSGTLGVRYRFLAAERWNWWLMAGLGGTTVARHDATKQERDAASRGHGVIGLGIERRFAQFALQAEVRAIKIGDKTADAMKMPVDGTVAAPAPAGTGPQSGASLTIGASYYF